MNFEYCAVKFVNKFNYYFISLKMSIINWSMKMAKKLKTSITLNFKLQIEQINRCRIE